MMQTETRSDDERGFLYNNHFHRLDISFHGLSPNLQRQVDHHELHVLGHHVGGRCVIFYILRPDVTIFWCVFYYQETDECK